MKTPSSVAPASVPFTLPGEVPVKGRVVGVNEAWVALALAQSRARARKAYRAHLARYGRRVRGI